MALTAIPQRKCRAVQLVSTDEYLLVVVLIEVRRLDGDFFNHIHVQGLINRLNVVIVRDVHGVG